MLAKVHNTLRNREIIRVWNFVEEIQNKAKNLFPISVGQPEKVVLVDLHHFVVHAPAQRSCKYQGHTP